VKTEKYTYSFNQKQQTRHPEKMYEAAVDMVRKLSGNTMPSAAEMGTIRGDYSVDSAAAANRDKRAVRNLVHASETPEEAKHEIEYWFAPEEMHAYTRAEEDAMF